MFVVVVAVFVVVVAVFVGVVAVDTSTLRGSPPRSTPTASRADPRKSDDVPSPSRTYKKGGREG